MLDRQYQREDLPPGIASRGPVLDPWSSEIVFWELCCGLETTVTEDERRLRASVLDTLAQAWDRVRQLTPERQVKKSAQGYATISESVDLGVVTNYACGWLLAAGQVAGKLDRDRILDLYETLGREQDAAARALLLSAAVRDCSRFDTDESLRDVFQRLRHDNYRLPEHLERSLRQAACREELQAPAAVNGTSA